MSDTAELEAELLALIKAATPGRWKVQRGKAGPMLLTVYDEELQDWRELAKFYIDPLRRDGDRTNARLAALAPGLAAAVELARVLRAARKARLATDDWQRKCVKQAHGDSHMRCGKCFLCLERKALACWDEALAQIADPQ